jgi:membrane protein YqaA with SNARE-associated domain
MAAITSRMRRYIAISIFAAMIIISVAGSIYLIKYFEDIKTWINQEGLLGLFLISLFAGTPIPIPTPSMILTFAMGSIVNPWIVGLVSGFGNSLGQSTGYWVGRGGLVFIKNLGISWKIDENSPSWFGRVVRKLSMPKMREFARRHVLWAVFVLGMYPNPVLMPIIVGMGAARYSFWKFYIVCWAGKTVEAMALSFLGYFGLRSILHYFGILLP